MSASQAQIQTLRDLLTTRDLTMDAAAVLAQVDTATISRICSGRSRATPQTVVRLARALGVNARRMARLCDREWEAREQRSRTAKAEELRALDIDVMAGDR
jgi:plasmid maintenance system antidote protein VapI